MPQFNIKFISNEYKNLLFHHYYKFFLLNQIKFFQLIESTCLVNLIIFVINFQQVQVNVQKAYVNLLSKDIILY